MPSELAITTQLTALADIDPTGTKPEKSFDLNKLIPDQRSDTRLL